MSKIVSLLLSQFFFLLEIHIDAPEQRIYIKICHKICSVYPRGLPLGCKTIVVSHLSQVMRQIEFQECSIYMNIRIKEIDIDIFTK